MRNVGGYFKYIILLLPFLMSPIVYTLTMPAFANFLLAYKFVSFLFIVQSYLVNGKFSNLDIAVFGYFVIWFISLIINGGNIIEYLKEVVVILSFLFIIEDAFNKSRASELLDAMTCILFAELSVNFVGMLLFPNGLWRTVSNYGIETPYAFLGLQNQITPIYIVAEMLLFLQIYRANLRIKPLSVFRGIVLILNMILSTSSTGVVGCILVPVLYVIGYKHRNIINIRTAVIIAFMIFVLFVIFRYQNIFSFFINGILHKSLTFTSRTGIWDRALGMIWEKPLLGYGYGTLASVVIDRNAHNFYLQILLQTGVLGLVWYFTVLRKALSGCWRNMKSTGSLIIASCLFGYMICFVFEVYSQAWLIILLSFAYNVGRLPGFQLMKREEELAL